MVEGQWQWVDDTPFTESLRQVCLVGQLSQVIVVRPRGGNSQTGVCDDDTGSGPSLVTLDAGRGELEVQASKPFIP